MYQVYQTGIGDTLENIASKFNITVDELKNINNDLDDFITPGSLVVVPSTYNNFSKYVVLKGDSIYSISKKYNVDSNTLLLINGLDKDEYIYPGETILIPKEGINVYITKDMSTLDDLNTLGDIHETIKLNSRIYLLPNQAILYKKES